MMDIEIVEKQMKYYENLVKTFVKEITELSERVAELAAKTIDPRPVSILMVRWQAAYEQKILYSAKYSAWKEMHGQLKRMGK